MLAHTMAIVFAFLATMAFLAYLAFAFATQPIDPTMAPSTTTLCREA